MNDAITAPNDKTSDKGGPRGPKYIINIEGHDYPWDKGTITTEEIATLGGWDIAQGVIEIDVDNNERTLKPGEVIEIKPGHGFAKKVRWKRGDNLLELRVAAELALLRTYYKDVDEQGGWVRIRNYPVSGPGWGNELLDIAFQIPTGYPGTPPYGIYVPIGLRYQGNVPKNYREPADNKPPFDGNWGFFSWTPDDGQWRPTASLVSGSNLLNFVRSFADRLREGP